MAKSLKIFKKSAPNGRLYLYLGKREFISSDGIIENIRGVAHAPECQDNLKGKYVFASLVCHFRHGREEDEIMGVSFEKELVVDRIQVYPPIKSEETCDKLQSRLLQKLGSGNAFPFCLSFPRTAPNSVLIRGEDGDAADMGVSYAVRLNVADHQEDFKGAKKTAVAMAIRKIQWASSDTKFRSPTATADKGFLCSKGKVTLECTIDKEVYYHGQEVPVHVSVTNNSRKSVKSIRCSISQHCELTMVGAQYSCKVARLETRDGCPLGPGASLNRTFAMKPLAQFCSTERGLALDAALSKVRDETNLASSSVAETGDSNDLLGVIVSYSVKVKIILSGMGGELEVDLPFKLVHPRPDSEEADKLEALKKVTAEENERSNKRRMKFQAQDSVIVSSFGGSQED